MSGKRASSSGNVLSILRFPEEMSESEKKVKVYLEQFLIDAITKTLENFLKFCTRAICLPNFGHGRIDVRFSDTYSIFSSMCLLQLNLPSSFDNFNSLLKAVMGDATKSFNCV